MHPRNSESGKVMGYVVGLFALVVAGLLGGGFFFASKTLYDLLSENKRLKEAITNLTREEQIGYAKVLSQEKRDGKVITTLKFVETARDDKLDRILEKEYSIEGDVVYFDALIVKFGDRMVLDGKERALYLWRRIYGERTAPDRGFLIESPGVEPRRYEDLLAKLSMKDREMFWSAIWDLANDPEQLREFGIQAIFGNAVYSKLRPGLIYVFKIRATGEVYPEVVPDM
jgi:hypothetical protein